MSPRGRPRKPTKLKLVEGNPGKRRLPAEGEEWEPGGEAEPSAGVMRDAAALAVWDELAPMLMDAGLLTAADGRAFSALCLLTADFDARPAGFPASKIAQLRGLYTDFGLTPSARARLPARPPEPEDEDPEEAFFD